MSDLVAFLRARLDEDEAAAKAAIAETAADWRADDHDLLYEDPEDGTQEVALDEDFRDGAALAHAAIHDPARVLREVAAKRAILELHGVHAEPSRWGDSHSDPAMRGQPTGSMSYWCEECDHDRDYGHIGGPDEGCRTLRHLAAAYSTHPDYDPAWAPETARA